VRYKTQAVQDAFRSSRFSPSPRNYVSTGAKSGIAARLAIRDDAGRDPRAVASSTNGQPAGAPTAEVCLAAMLPALT